MLDGNLPPGINNLYNNFMKNKMIAGAYYDPGYKTDTSNTFSLYMVDENGKYVDSIHEKQIHLERLKKILKDFIGAYKCKVLVNNDEPQLVVLFKELGYEHFLIPEPKLTNKSHGVYGIFTQTSKVYSLLRSFIPEKSETKDILTEREIAKALALYAWSTKAGIYEVGNDPYKNLGGDSLGAINVYKRVTSYKVPTIIENLVNIIKSNPEFTSGGCFIGNKSLYSYSLEDNTFKLTINL